MAIISNSLWLHGKKKSAAVRFYFSPCLLPGYAMKIPNYLNPFTYFKRVGGDTGMVSSWDKLHWRPYFRNFIFADSRIDLKGWSSLQNLSLEMSRPAWTAQLSKSQILLIATKPGSRRWTNRFTQSYKQILMLPTLLMVLMWRGTSPVENGQPSTATHWWHDDCL